MKQPFKLIYTGQENTRIQLFLVVEDMTSVLECTVQGKPKHMKMMINLVM